MILIFSDEERPFSDKESPVLSKFVLSLPPKADPLLLSEEDEEEEDEVL